MTTNVPHRPGGLTALCILAIVLGALGVLSTLGAIAAAAYQSPLQEAIARFQAKKNEEAARLQQQLDDETREFTQRHPVRNILFAVAELLVASGLLAGGILTLRLSSYGRMLLMIAFGAAIVLELAQLWPAMEAIPFTQRTIQLSMEAQQKEMNAQGPNADDAAAMMRVMAKAIAALQVLVFAGKVLLKIGFYAFGLWYLTRPRVAGLFVRQKPVDPQWA
jgi:hypothetical protein